jgi:transposase-like protein
VSTGRTFPTGVGAPILLEGLQVIGRVRPSRSSTGLKHCSWYLRYGLSYRDVEELLAERGVEVDHVTVYRWVQRFTPLFADAARPRRHATGDCWFVDETYVKVAGQWRYLYRAVDQFGQVIDVFLSERRDTWAARRFFEGALRHGPAPVEVTTDKAGPYLRVLDELVPAAAHVTEQHANNRVRS